MPKDLPEITALPESYKPCIGICSGRTATDLETLLNEDAKQACIIVWKREDFLISEHGRANANSAFLAELGASVTRTRGRHDHLRHGEIISFDTSFMPPSKVLFNGKNLQDNFRGDIKGRVSVILHLAEVPNYFCFLGAYGSLAYEKESLNIIGHGSVQPIIEHVTEHVLQIIERARKNSVKRLSVKRSVSEDFTRYPDEYLKLTGWSGPCNSWSRNGKISNKPVLWPGSPIHLLTVLQCPRFENFDFEYLDGNSYSFLRDRFDMREVDGAC
ncbi:hypothetical protein COCHEDRAFT_1029375 [Bipolaris maydis C5]|uniref:Uncharacterized protein n=1 Tax=Cochliobolus heterostrophus (strain C5 / ATCC 48332 / race O) TaxID=701091 RepID=M2UHJ0_COCH5|nr:hypothetical protein COCHEDRAFT_1029375 [Bipolaris maydis C5]